MARESWIPSYQAGPHLLRVVDSNVHKAQEPYVRNLLRQASSLDDGTVLNAMGGIIDPLLSESVTRARSGTWPYIPASLVADAAMVGTSVALIERRNNLYRNNLTHPGIHVLLWTLAVSVADELPMELAQIPVEVAYLAVRADLPVSAVIAD